MNIPEKSADKVGVSEVAEWNKVGARTSMKNFEMTAPRAAGEFGDELERAAEDERNPTAPKDIMDDRQGDARDR